MFDVIIFIGTFACAFMGGWGIRGIVATDYKKRWETAQKVIEADPTLLDTKKLQDLELEVKRLREENQGLLSAPVDNEKDKDIALLLTLPPKDRYELEGTRLQELYDPIDPLTNLPPAYILSMKKRRLQHGYE
jgi:hypothetical protein